jgi:hypothetical protein
MALKASEEACIVSGFMVLLDVRGGQYLKRLHSCISTKHGKGRFKMHICHFTLSLSTIRPSC